MLERQISEKPSDLSALKALITLRKGNGEWSKVASAATRLVQAKPEEIEFAFLAIEAAFRAGEFERGKELSQPFLQPDSPVSSVGKVLERWRDRWNGPDAVNEAMRLSSVAAESSGKRASNSSAYFSARSRFCRLSAT